MTSPTYVGNGLWIGISTDTNPTGIPTGSRLYHTDTGLQRIYDGAAWVLVPKEANITLSNLGGTLGVTQGGTGITTQPKGVIHFNAIFSSAASSSYLARFFPFASVVGSSTESLMQITYPFGFTVTRALAKMNVNGLNGSSVFSFRDDAADVTGTALTITTGSTTEVDSGALSVAVAAGSKLCFKFDTSASASGTWLMSHYFIIGTTNIVV